jgi:ubiquinone/menaquinone biosynthesis C-methylase UbiE
MAKMSEDRDNPAYDAVLAYQRTAMVLAAHRLDVFTLIGSGCAAIADLAERTGTSPRGMRILCDSLTAIDLLEKSDPNYRLSASAGRYLDRGSPGCIADCIDFFCAPEMMELVLGDPVSYVRNGGAVGSAHLAPDHPIWVRFAKAMTPIASLTAKRAAARLASASVPIASVLDVAAGHGLYGIEVGKIRAEAVVAAVDWPSVLELASANASAAGLGARFRPVAGSAFEVDWGAGFDLVILANFLHHFDPGECTQILRKVRSSLSPKGRAAAVEFVPDEGRVSPPMQALLAFRMLATTPAGDAYTASDLDAFAKAAGFAGTSVLPLRPTPQSLVLFETEGEIR